MLWEFKFDCESSKLLLVLGQNSSLFFDKFLGGGRKKLNSLDRSQTEAEAEAEAEAEVVKAKKSR